MAEKTIIVGVVLCPDGVARGKMPSQLIEQGKDRGKPNPRYTKALAVGEEKTIDKLAHAAKRTSSAPLTATTEKAVIEAVRTMLSEDNRRLLDPDKATPVSVSAVYTALARGYSAAIAKALGDKLVSLWVPGKTSAAKDKSTDLANIEEQ